MTDPKRPNEDASATEPQRKAAVYVDETQSPQDGHTELIAILRSNALGEERYDAIVVFCDPSIEIDDEVKDAIAILAEQGTVVTFNR